MHDDVEQEMDRERPATDAGFGLLNMISLSGDGTFGATGGSRSRPEDVHAIFRHLQERQISHLVLYFHGGLVDSETAIAGARGLVPLFRDRVGAHPVFFIWGSGLLEVLRFNVQKIGQTTFFRELLDAVMEFVISKLKSTPHSRGIGISLVPKAEVEREKARERAAIGYVDEEDRSRLDPVNSSDERQFEQYQKGKIYFQNEVTAIEAGQVGVDSTMFSQDVFDRIEAEKKAAGSGRSALFPTAVLIKSAVQIFRRAVGRILGRTDHGIYCTVVEEILREFYIGKFGTWVWDEIKRQTQDAFASNIGLDGEAQHGGTCFLEDLRDYLHAGTSPLKVSLVGHSAGAIYICHLLDKAAAILGSGFQFDRVLLLAPAVGFDLFNAAVVEHPERFRSLRMYALKDVYEAQDVMVPVLYPRSLLYFVAALLEGDGEVPLVGMERFYSGRRPYDSSSVLATRDFLHTDGFQRVVWAVTAGNAGGLNCAATSHGGFAEEETTQISMAHALRD
jgi:hypothetical protein